MTIFLPKHESFLQELPERKRAFVIGNLLLYVFHGCQQADIREALAEKKIPFDFLGWRRHLHRNGPLLRDGKLHVYAKAARKPLCPTTLGLSETDLDLLNLGLRYRPLKEHLREVQDTPFCRVLTARQLDRFIERVLVSEDLVGYTRKFIRRKMSFIMKSYGKDLEEIEESLKIYALYGLQRAYPRFEHVGHGIAIAKTLIKRSGNNFIKEMTTQKRNELIHDGDTGSYSKTTVSLDTIADGSGQFLTADGTHIHRSLLVVGLSGNNGFDKLPWDTLHALKELCSSSSLKAKQREFLGLMMGNYSEAFSAFLGAENDDVLENIPYNSYMNKVCAFLRIPPEAATDFLQNLRPHLGGNLVSQFNN